MTNEYFLSHGSHATPQQGRCAMEWVSYIAGEPHSDTPACVSPVLRDFGISLNDNWDDEQRQKLRPYLARCIGTAGDGRDEERGWLAMDWLIRVFTPRFLDLVPELHGHAARLRGLAPVMASVALDDAMIVLGDARQASAAAGAAAWAAARDAAGDAAWDAAGAGHAAWDAALPGPLPGPLPGTLPAWTLPGTLPGPLPGPGTLPGTAAGAAAGDAARAAARAVLKPAVVDLQASALDLFDRMLPKELVELPAVSEAEWRAVCAL
jgi:hypothetical protein